MIDLCFQNNNPLLINRLIEIKLIVIVQGDTLQWLKQWEGSEKGKQQKVYNKIYCEFAKRKSHEKKRFKWKPWKNLKGFFSPKKKYIRKRRNKN